MAKKKQPGIRVGLYTLIEAVDQWLRDETAEYDMVLVSKQDNDTDTTGLDAILLMDIVSPQRAEDLYLFAQDAIAQGIHIIWACDGQDAWFRQVNQEMFLKKQTVIDFEQTDDPVRLLRGLIELNEKWQVIRSVDSDEESRQEELEVELTDEENSVGQEEVNAGVSEVGVAAAIEEVVLTDDQKGIITKASPVSMDEVSNQKNTVVKNHIFQPTTSKFEKIKQRVTPGESRDQKLVVKEKFVRVGTTTIAVVNASRGSGCTYSAIQMGLFLRRFSKNVAVIELRDERNPKSGSFMTFMNGQEDSLEDAAVHINGIDFASTYKPSGILRNKKYDYVVMDIGSLQFYSHTGNLEQNKHIDELERATIGCITSAGSPWGMYDLSQFLIEYSDNRLDWNILLQHPSAEQKHDLEENLRSISETYRVFGFPCQPDPFVLEEETAKELKQLMQHVIPQDEQKVHFLRKIFK